MGRIRIIKEDNISVKPDSPNLLIANDSAQSREPEGGFFSEILQGKTEIVFTAPNPVHSSSEARANWYNICQVAARRYPTEAARAVLKIKKCTLVSRDGSPQITVRLQYDVPLADQWNACAHAVWCSGEEEVTDCLREAMIRREETLAVLAPESLNSKIDYCERIFQKHVEGSFNDYVYLRKHFSTQSQQTVTNLGLKLLVFKTTYKTTWEQEQVLYAAVDNAIREMGLDRPGVSGYDKIRKVYTYIAKNVVYDDDYKRYTAYHAMIEKCAVCQGCATLFYLFMRKLGIPVDYIWGTTDNDEGSHGWNIVKHGHYWYCIDTTWEHVRKGKRLTIQENRYFLKSPDDFKNHKPASVFLEEAFLREHPFGKHSI